jgi:hypothetical protein
MYCCHRVSTQLRLNIYTYTCIYNHITSYNLSFKLPTTYFEQSVVWSDAHYDAYKTSWLLSHLHRADPRSSAVYGVCPKPLGCWDCGFEFRYSHGCSYVVFLCVVYVRPTVEERSLGRSSDKTAPRIKIQGATK